MKNFYLILILCGQVLFAQDYQKKWNRVVSLETRGKIRSAKNIADKIYSQAVEDKNETQIIKSFFYNSKYLNTLDEDAQFTILNNLQKEIGRLSTPSKAILHHVYAKCLESYISKSYSNISRRTKTDSLSSNFKTWSYEDFRTEIESAWALSIKNDGILSETPLRNYEQIFDFTLENDFQDLTVFDYLITEYIEHLRTSFPTAPSRSRHFPTQKQHLLGKADAFVNVSLDSLKDTELKQILIAFQKREKYNPTAKKEFERLKFLTDHVFNSDVDRLALWEEKVKTTTHSATKQQVKLALADQLLKMASKDVTPDFNIKALEILREIDSSHSPSYATAQYRIQNIISKEVSIKMKAILYPGQNSRAHITYKNTAKLNVSFYKINRAVRARFQNRKLSRDSLLADITSRQNPVKSLSLNLPEKHDFFRYTTEVLMPKLQHGVYMVHFEGTSQNVEAKADAVEFITVTDLSVLSKNKGDVDRFQVLDRKTGFPITGALLKMDSCDGKSDPDGWIDCPHQQAYSRQNEEFVVSYQGDTLSMHKGYMYRQNENSSDTRIGKVQFYLDRAIYRPGQKVYFKGIAVGRKKQDASVIEGLPLKITVTNVNDETVFSTSVKTNSFGSFHGEFDLPTGGLTGQFEIEAEEPESVESGAATVWDDVDYFENSAHGFYVEEYKRPKFEVKFAPIKEKLKLNEPASVKGNAISFAGNAISDAKVTYKIERATFRNYWDNYPEEQDSIASGETTTDNAGNFIIGFTAKAYDNHSLARPVFKYIVHATVTDVNGETRTGTTDVRLGFHSVALEVDMPYEVHAKAKNAVMLNSTNLNGEFMPVTGRLEIFKVADAPSKFQPRMFPKPEIELITAEDFEKLFPYEDNSISLQRSKTPVYSQEIRTGERTTYPLDLKTLKAGVYSIVFSTVDGAHKIERESTFTVLRDEKGIDPSKILNIEEINKNPVKDGFIDLRLTSIVPNLFLKKIVMIGGKTIVDEVMRLSNQQAQIRIPIDIKDGDEVLVAFEGIFDNNYFSEQKKIDLKVFQPKLEFEVETFRNKIEPGAKETWSFRIKAENTQRESEILASMYDSSLDQFRLDRWQPISLDRNSRNYFSHSIMAGQNYMLHMHVNNLNRVYRHPIAEEESIKLIWFGFDFGLKTSYPSKTYRDQLAKKQKPPKDTKLVSGIVSDGTGPIPGANIRVKGTQRAAVTDIDGYYEIRAAAGEVLIFSFVGMNDEVIKIGKSRVINAYLNEGGMLAEVVVTGALGIRRIREAVPSSQQVIKAEELTQSADPNAVLALLGKVSGLEINTSDKAHGATRVVLRGNRSLSGNNQALVVIDGEISTLAALNAIPPKNIVSISVIKGPQAAALYGSQGVNGVIIVVTGKSLEQVKMVKARSNLSETAFFYPNLTTDSSGRIKFSFTAPEALTQWKLRLQGHNKKAVSAYHESLTATQKELMVVPNLPRFFRENDTIVLSAKIANMTKEAKVGIALLQLSDAATMASVDAKSLNADNMKNFSVAPFSNTIVQWRIAIPKGLPGMQCKIIAKSGSFSDGEQTILPVLTNDLFVTESIPVWVLGKSTQNFSFENLKNNPSKTLRNHRLTFEYTSNPTWLAIKSLPYLMEYEHECSEQTFSKLYANCLASNILDSSPKVAGLFKSWLNDPTVSTELETNQELKSIVLAETPWLNDAKSEARQKKDLAILFDAQKVSGAKKTFLKKLQQKQLTSGGFPWFDGGRESLHITKHILSGFGRLQKLGADEDLDREADEMISSGINYLDRQFASDATSTSRIMFADVPYLYCRSFFINQVPVTKKLDSLINLNLEKLKKSWLTYPIHDKAAAALTLYRFGERSHAKLILDHFKETASNSSESGMYWIENISGRSWYQSPIATQALLIEAFIEIDNDKKSADAMKAWLLKSRRGQNWPTTKSTSEAVYAILLHGNDWTSVRGNTIVEIGGESLKSVNSSQMNAELDAGYLKNSWNAEQITPKMADVTIQNKSIVPAIGNIHWQYFEDADAVRSKAGNGISVTKELFVKSGGLNAPILKRISGETQLKVGDLVTSRIIITATESLDYIHLKDMRASCFEPADVMSEYKWQDGLGYYMSTKDAATHFFFDSIEKGVYVLEYDVRVNNVGEFSNGITTIQSMYAPEFSSHTNGIRVAVE